MKLEDKNCPQCGGRIVWYLNNLEIGASSFVTCVNGISASRVDWDPENSIICEWLGRVIRVEDGKLQFIS